MDLKNLMAGLLKGLWPNAASATPPTVGTQAGNEATRPSKNISDLSEASSIMAQAAVGRANPAALIETIDIAIT